MQILLDPGKPFSLQDFETAAFGKVKVSASPGAKRRVAESHKRLLKILSDGQIKIYGIHTGFGSLQGSDSGARDWARNQKELVFTHACGVGRPMADSEARAMIYLRALQLSRGYSGVRPQTFEKYLSLLSGSKVPRIPSQGSVGASGDLLPLAHAAREIFLKMPESEIGPRDGLALINGTEASTAVGLLAASSAEALFDYFLAVSALTLFALKGKTESWGEAVVGLKKHPFSVEVSARLRVYLGRYQAGGLPQDPYSLRAVPQVGGAAWEMLEGALSMLAREASSVTDNPAILEGEKPIQYGANFHGAYTAAACDQAAIALVQISQMSERRTDTLLSGHRELPKMLASGGGSGLQMAQVMQAALLADSRILAAPASVQSISTNAGQEDVVPMAMGAALKLKKILFNASRILAAEALSAGRAVALSGRQEELKAKTGLKDFWRELESRSKSLLLRDGDGASPALEKIAAFLRGGRIEE